MNRMSWLTVSFCLVNSLHSFPECVHLLHVSLIHSCIRFLCFAVCITEVLFCVSVSYAFALT